jgi:RNA-directed DNA polymerase
MAQVSEQGACSMTVKALMPARKVNLVAPLAHEATAMHTTDTAAKARAASGAATALIGEGLRSGGVDSATGPRTPGTRTSTTATRTTTTRALKAPLLPSADPHLFPLLVQAYLDCRRTKRCSASAQAFEDHAERNLLQLNEELISGAYTPGQSVCFVITRPKPREVWAARFRDRVVHHLLYNHIAPRFHRAFIADSCACIPGRGTLYAATRLEHHVRSVSANWSRPASYLKADLANFFVSIDKGVLFAQLQRRVHEPWWLSLAETILMHDPRTDVEVRGRRDELALVPPHKSLFNAPAGHGLPIGNLSSQFFANVLLDPFDQWVKHTLKVPYVRYVDDFVLLHPSPQALAVMLPRIDERLAELHLRLNPRKTILQPLERGIDFVGQVLRPWRRTIRPRTTVSAMSRVAEVEAIDLHQTTNSYFGLFRQASHSHADRARLANIVRQRGHCVDAALTKCYRHTR